MIKRGTSLQHLAVSGSKELIETGGHALAWSTFLIKRGTPLQHLAVSGSKELSNSRTCSSMEHLLDQERDITATSSSVGIERTIELEDMH